jgi:hypothetical protein
MSAATLNGGEAAQACPRIPKRRVCRSDADHKGLSVVRCPLLDANRAKWAFQLIGART